MTGVRFKDWETFLRYVGSQEKMKHKEEWRKATELWDMDDLEPDCGTKVIPVAF